MNMGPPGVLWIWGEWLFIPVQGTEVQGKAFISFDLHFLIGFWGENPQRPLANLNIFPFMLTGE